MIRIALAQVIANRVRLAFTLIAVVLGVTLATGSLVLNDTAQRLFDTQFRAANSGVDLTVRKATAFDSGMGIEVQRDPLPAGMVDTIAAVPHIGAAVPVAQGSARFEQNGRDLGTLQLSTWVKTPLGAFPVRSGRAPSVANDVALDARTAAARGLHLGDRITLVAEDRVPLTIVGLVGFGSSDGPPAGSIALTTLPTAQRALHLGTAVSAILVSTSDPITQMQRTLETDLGSSIEVASAKDLAAAGAEAAAANLEMLQIVLMAISIASLIIGCFLIANTFSIVVTQRTRELAVLRAAGATGAQVFRSVIVEAVIVGTVAASAGTLAGIGAAFGLRQIAILFGVAIPTGPLVIEPRTVIIGVILGVIVTVLAAITPARRAASISPIAAMRTSSTEPLEVGRARIVAASTLTVLGVVGAMASAFGASMGVLALGATSTVVGVVLGAPVLMPQLSRFVGRPLDQLGVPGRLARDAAARAPRRTSATVMALALGLALMMFVSIVGSSVKAGTAERYREVISADAVIESAGQEMLGGVHADVYDQIKTLPDVGFATRLRFGHWKEGEITNALAAIDPRAIGRVANLQLVKGSLAGLSSGGVVVADRAALQDHLRVGDQLTMTFARTGQQRLRVVGILADSTAQALMSDYVISLETYSKQYTENMDASLFVKAAHGVTLHQLRSSLTAALVDHPGMVVHDQAAVIAGRNKTVDQILGLVTMLLVLAILIAVLGITNTLALSIIERSREIGLLRAVGMRSRQAGFMVLAEAVLVAVIAVAIGAALGLGAGTATVDALTGIAPLKLVVPVSEICGLAALIAAAGLLAGIAPARRAATMPVLEAIAHD